MYFKMQIYTFASHTQIAQWLQAQQPHTLPPEPPNHHHHHHHHSHDNMITLLGRRRCLVFALLLCLQRLCGLCVIHAVYVALLHGSYAIYLNTICLAEFRANALPPVRAIAPSPGSPRSRKSFVFASCCVFCCAVLLQHHYHNDKYPPCCHKDQRTENERKRRSGSVRVN